MSNMLEDLTTQFNSAAKISPEIKMFMENPAKSLALSYDALTEDLDKRKAKDDPSSKDWVISRALQNQARHIMETTTTTIPSGQDHVFSTIALPLVRKIFSKLLAMDLVSVQPINQPTAKIFYLDFEYHTAPVGGHAGDRLDDVRDSTYSTSYEAGPVAEIDMKITNETVTAVQKKLKAVWTVELEQDLASYQNLSAEAELMTVLQEQIVREVDGMIITALLNGAMGIGSGTGTGAGNVNWNINGQLAGDTATTYLRDYKRTIYEAIVDASNLIFKKRFRYANWIIGHPDAIVRLEKLEEFHLTEKTNPGEYTVGRHLVGSLNDRFQVYKDPFFPVTNKLLLGYKGNSWVDSVGFYAPYIPLYVTPKMIDPNDFTPRKGLMSRFAYGTLIKDGLATVTLTTS